MAKVELSLHSIDMLFNSYVWNSNESLLNVNVYIEKNFQDPVIQREITAPYVFTTPLINTTEFSKIFDNKVRKSDIEKIMQQHSMHIKHAYYQDISERYWLFKPVMLYVLNKLSPSKFNKWCYNLITNKSKMWKVTPQKRYLMWERTSKLEALQKTVLVQAPFVDKNYSMSLQQIADHYGKHINEMIILLKRHGMIGQIGKTATFWHPSIAQRYRGQFGTYQPKNKEVNAKTGEVYYNVYCHKDGLAVIDNIVFNKLTTINLPKSITL
jgi:hypothetical protein